MTTFLDCGGTYRINSGQNIEILSPNSGTGSYPAYSSCQWRLLANESTRLVVSFSQMDLEPCEHAFYDYIQVYKGVNEGITLKESLCKTPDHYISVDGNMTIRFLSDGTNSRTGFKIRVNATRGEFICYNSNKKVPFITIEKIAYLFLPLKRFI